MTRTSGDHRATCGGEGGRLAGAGQRHVHESSHRIVTDREVGRADEVVETDERTIDGRRQRLGRDHAVERRGGREHAGRQRHHDAARGAG